MNETQGHTPGPLEYRPTFTETKTRMRCLCLYGGPRNKRRLVHVVENPDAEDEANAERLARCWNTHDDLLAACKDMLAECGDIGRGNTDHPIGSFGRIAQYAKQAIAKATTTD